MSSQIIRVPALLTELDVPAPSASLYLRRNAGDTAYEWASAGVSDHGGLGGLTDDDHPGAAWLAGRAGGQTLVGGTGSGENLTLSGTSHATPGNVVMANGQLLLASGAVSAPSISFGFDTDTGFRSQSAGDLRAVGNGSDVFQFTAAANTSMRAFDISNTYGFTVNGGTATFNPASAAGVPVIIKGAASQTANLTSWQNSAGTTRTFIDSAQRLTLPVGGLGSYDIRFAYEGSTPTIGYIQAQAGGSATIVISAGDRVLNSGAWTSPGATNYYAGSALQLSGQTMLFHTFEAAALVPTTVLTINKTGYTFSPGAATSGSPTLLTLTGPAHTTLTASAEAIDVDLALTRTVQFATGALATQRAVVIRPPTYGFVGASTLTTGVTFEVLGAPVAGTNATITNRYGARFKAATSGEIPLVVQGFSGGGNLIFRTIRGDGVTAMEQWDANGALLVSGTVQSADAFSFAGAASITRNGSTGMVTVNPQTISTSGFMVAATHASQVIGTFKGAASHTGNAIEVQSSTGAVGLSVSVGGTVTLAPATNNSRLIPTSNYLEINVGGTECARFRPTSGNLFQVVMLGANGSASAPAWSHFNDTDSGEYRVGADHIGLAAGASLIMSVRRESSVDKWGVFTAAAAPVAQAAALTQTYSTADRTLSAYTPDAESSAYTGIDNAQGGSVYATLADLNALRVAVENLRAFTEDGVQFLNAMVDDMQAYGLEQ